MTSLTLVSQERRLTTPKYDSYICCVALLYQTCCRNLLGRMTVPFTLKELSLNGTRSRERSEYFNIEFY